MKVAETNKSSSRMAVVLRPTIVGMAIVVFAALSDGAIERRWIIGLLAVGAAILAYSFVIACRTRRTSHAVVALILLSITFALPFLRIWTGASPVWRTPRSLFERGFDFE